MSFQKALGGFLARHRKLRLDRNGTEEFLYWVGKGWTIKLLPTVRFYDSRYPALFYENSSEYPEF